MILSLSSRPRTLGLFCNSSRVLNIYIFSRTSTQVFRNCNYNNAPMLRQGMQCADVIHIALNGIHPLISYTVSLRWCLLVDKFYIYSYRAGRSGMRSVVIGCQLSYFVCLCVSVVETFSSGHATGTYSDPLA